MGEWDRSLHHLHHFSLQRLQEFGSRSTTWRFLTLDETVIQVSPDVIHHTRSTFSLPSSFFFVRIS